MTGKKALGKGLEALISSGIAEEPLGESVQLISLGDIIPSRNQPRRSFDEEKIDELAHSIQKNGLIQPIVVRESGNKYEIIVGERRFRAAKKAGLGEIPAFIKDYSENKGIEIALIENIQREDLNPIEESLAYRMILSRENITQEELSKRIGKSRSYIANMVRLLELSSEIQEHVSRGTISVGQAKAIVSLGDKDAQEAMVKKILDEHLTVRDVERLTRRKNVPHGTVSVRKDPYIDEIEEKLRSRFGTKVSIDYRKGRGTIKIAFYSSEELERIIDEMTT